MVIQRRSVGSRLLHRFLLEDGNAWAAQDVGQHNRAVNLLLIRTRMIRKLYHVDE